MNVWSLLMVATVVNEFVVSPDGGCSVLLLMNVWSLLMVAAVVDECVVSADRAFLGGLQVRLWQACEVL